MERHVPELYDWVKKQKRSGARGAVRHLGRGLLVTECLATTLYRRQRAMPACRTLHRKCVETRGCCDCGRDGENEAIWSGFAIAGLRDLRKTGRRRHQVAARLGEDGGERAVQPTRCWTMEDPVGTSAAVCSSRHLLASTGVRVAERPAAEPPLLQAE